MRDELFQINKDRALTTICKIEDELNSLQSLNLNDLNLEHTLFIVIDMINGFAKKGNLASDRVKNLIPKISELLSNKNNLNKIFICDAHSEKSIEFQSYPLHALYESEESQVVDELLPYLDDETIVLHKNSTNAMASKGLKLYLEEHNEIDNFILIGDCTDICILQCALGLKSHFNELNYDKIRNISV